MTAPKQPAESIEQVYDEKKAARWGALWWTLSLVLHAAFISAIVYFTPLRQYFFGKEQTDPLADVDASEVQAVADSLIGVAEARVREDVATLGTLLGKLRDARDRRHRFYVAETTRVRGSGGAETPESKGLESLGPTGPDIPKVKAADLRLFALYDLAQAIEQNCFGVYRQMKSVELARIQALDLAEAFESTKIALPVHPPVDHAVFRLKIEDVRDGKLAKLKSELFRIRAETSDMVASVRRMMDIAEGLIGDSPPGAIVLSPGGLQVSGTGLRKWGASAGPPLSPLEIFPAGSGEMPANFLPPAVRKIMQGAQKSDWMALDTWYIIGPFPNPKREYMDKKFPPESVIDLDATYVGKNNAKLEWEYTQARPYWPVAPRVADSYAIWYAFTEVYSEKDQTKVCLFGSDDYSKVWVNGELVYTSGKDPHHWIPDRGFQKVFLRKGVNPILLKLENAGGTTGFSMCIFLGELGG
jgi:hypothetical protein